ncbi:streptogramin lyase [Caldalkalibacillus uzonensis]|uniref:Streptogramin lyase n=1 Tax=Caldalkalibacillus uzonensis TaxID=353224 RepID=A0ABU0CQ90_9BACI|nr:WD40 repeat domain-containing protein [Caldalkalibacillus uzonensis]MDQ0338578.1 streptogramin lyase [Caldalkalibacillus uzonensis]
MTIMIMIVSFGFYNKTVAEDIEERIEHLGTAINSVVIPHAAYGKGPNGENWMYVVANGSPPNLNIIGVETGERVDNFPLEGAHTSWGLTVAPDGTLYIGSQRNGNLYRYIPGMDNIENLGRPISSETHLWRLVADDKGKIYGGTYPNGKVFQYDPETNQFRDYGQMVQSEWYVRSVAYGNGKIYAGTGNRQAHLVELDVETGEKEIIPLPEEYSSDTEVYDMSYVEGFLFARVTPSSTMLVYDTKTREWIDAFKNANGWDASPLGPSNKTYFKVDNKLYYFDVVTKESGPTGFSISGTDRSYGWYKIDDDNFPGLSLVSTNLRGRYYIYNPETGNNKIIQGDVLGSPVDIRSIHLGPDGNIYVGGYLSPGAMARIDTSTKQIEMLYGPGQIEAMATYQGKLYTGNYPDGQIWEYDPSEPWNYGKNPKQVAELSSNGQDRPFAFADAGNYLAIGTVPKGGSLEGALSFYDPETGETEVFRNVVENHSVISLAYKDGLIYGGTSIYGGIGINPVETEGKLFIWDVEKKEKVWEGSLIPGEQAISALAFDENGMLWGLTYGYIFKFNPETREVVQLKELYPYEWGTTFWAGGYLNFHKDGYLYGRAVNNIFKLDPETWEVETLVDGASYFAQDYMGDIYFSQIATQLYVYKLKYEDEPVSSETVMQLVELYKKTGNLEPPLYTQLKNSIKQSMYHEKEGRVTQAIKHLRRFLNHLNNPALDKYVSQDAKDTLNMTGETLLQEWENR